MKYGMGGALGLCAVLLVSCRERESSPRVATPSETLAILTPILPHAFPKVHAFAKVRVCVGAHLNPPLDRERHDLATNRQIQNEKPLLRRLQEKLDTLFSGPEEREPAIWYQEGPDKSLPLQTKDSAHLDELLKRASNASLPKDGASWTIPTQLKACDEHDEEATAIDSSPVFRFYFTQPVVLGNIAFVEEAGACGVTCGGGSMKALIKRNGLWSILAVRPTWIA